MPGTLADAVHVAWRKDPKAHRNLTDQRETVRDSGEHRSMEPRLETALIWGNA